MSAETPERIISKYESVKLEGKGMGRLVLTDRRIIFEKKKGILSSKVIPEVTIDARALISVEQLQDFGVKIVHEGKKETISHKVTPNNPTDAIEIVQTISSMLGERKLIRDKSELSEKDSKMAKAKYLSYVLDTGSKIWELTSLSLSMLRGLGFEDWDRAEDIFERLSRTTASLSEENSFDFSNEIDLIRTSVESRSPEKVGEAISGFLDTVGNQLSSTTPTASEWKDYIHQENPNWDSLSYLFLFSLAVNEGIAFEENALESEKQTALSSAKKLIPILGVEFSQDLFKDLKTEGNEARFAEMASEFNVYLRDALQDSLRETSFLA